MVASLGMLIEEVHGRSPSTNPLDQLATAATTADALNRSTDALLSHFVDQCRRAGHSWSEIGTSLGVTKQAVQRRFTRELSEPRGWDRFTDRARRVIEHHAPTASAKLEHSFVGTEHLLLALWDEPHGIAAHALRQMEVHAATVVDGINDRIRDVAPGQGGYTPRAWVAIENAGSVALEFNHNYVGTEHLLISIAAVAGTAQEILTEQRLTAERVRAEVTSLLS